MSGEWVDEKLSDIWTNRKQSKTKFDWLHEYTGGCTPAPEKINWIVTNDNKMVLFKSFTKNNEIPPLNNGFVRVMIGNGYVVDEEIGITQPHNLDGVR